LDFAIVGATAAINASQNNSVIPEDAFSIPLYAFAIVAAYNVGSPHPLLPM